MTSRRSFLAALAGSVASRVLPGKTHQQAALDRFDEIWEQLKETCKDGPVWQPFWIWEWSELSGKAERFEILPPPLPDEMLVEQAGVYFPAEVRSATLSEILNTWEMRLSLNQKDVLAGPIRYLFGSTGMRFALPLDVRKADNFRIELKGDGFETSEPVKIQTVFTGLVRIA